MSESIIIIDPVPATAFPGLRLAADDQDLSLERESHDLWLEFTPHRLFLRYSEYSWLDGSDKATPIR